MRKMMLCVEKECALAIVQRLAVSDDLCQLLGSITGVIE